MTGINKQIKYNQDEKWKRVRWKISQTKDNDHKSLNTFPQRNKFHGKKKKWKLENSKTINIKFDL